MSLPSKNSNLAMFAAIAVSTMLLTAVNRADANPYMQGDTRIAEGDASTTVKKTTIVKPAAVKGKKKIQSVGGARQTGGAFVAENGPSFVKSGSKPDLKQKIQIQPGETSIPSAVDVEKKIKSPTQN